MAPVFKVPMTAPKKQTVVQNLKRSFDQRDAPLQIPQAESNLGPSMPIVNLELTVPHCLIMMTITYQ